MDDLEYYFVVTFMRMPCTKKPSTWDVEGAFQPQKLAEAILETAGSKIAGLLERRYSCDPPKK